VIFPEPVTLNLFFALELVFTFGIILLLTFTPCWRSAPADTYGALWAIILRRNAKMKRAAKLWKKSENSTARC
jgi:hypothetical protein